MIVFIIIVKVMFCNGVIHDHDCQGCVLKGIFNLPQLFIGQLLCTRCWVEPADLKRNRRTIAPQVKSSLAFQTAESPLEV